MQPINASVGEAKQAGNFGYTSVHRGMDGTVESAVNHAGQRVPFIGGKSPEQIAEEQTAAAVNVRNQQADQERRDQLARANGLVQSHARFDERGNLIGGINLKTGETVSMVNGKLVGDGRYNPALLQRLQGDQSTANTNGAAPATSAPARSTVPAPSPYEGTVRPTTPLGSAYGSARIIPNVPTSPSDVVGRTTDAQNRTVETIAGGGTAIIPPTQPQRVPSGGGSGIYVNGVPQTQGADGQFVADLSRAAGGLNVPTPRSAGTAIPVGAQNAVPAAGSMFHPPSNPLANPAVSAATSEGAQSALNVPRPSSFGAQTAGNSVSASGTQFATAHPEAPLAFIPNAVSDFLSHPAGSNDDYDAMAPASAAPSNVPRPRWFATGTPPPAPSSPPTLNAMPTGTLGATLPVSNPPLATSAIPTAPQFNAGGAPGSGGPDAGGDSVIPRPRPSSSTPITSSAATTLAHAPSASDILARTPGAADSLASAPSAATRLNQVPGAADSLARTPGAAQTLASQPGAADTLARTPSATASLAGAPSAATTLATAPSAASTLASAPTAASTLASAPSARDTLARTPGAGDRLAAIPGAGDMLLNVPRPSTALASMPGAGDSLARMPTAGDQLARTAGAGDQLSGMPGAGDKLAMLPGAGDMLATVPRPQSQQEQDEQNRRRIAGTP